MPTKKEIEEHQVTHWPFRSWCKHCVKSKSNAKLHVTGKDQVPEEEQVPVISTDYMWMNDQQSEMQDGGKPQISSKTNGSMRYSSEW